MRAAIPSGSLIFSDVGTLRILAYYSGDNELPGQASPPEEFSEILLGGRWRVATRDYAFLTPDTYRAGLAARGNSQISHRNM
jgi:hypothetical protein